MQYLLLKDESQKIYTTGQLKDEIVQKINQSVKNLDKMIKPYTAVDGKIDVKGFFNYLSQKLTENE